MSDKTVFLPDPTSFILHPCCSAVVQSVDWSVNWSVGRSVGQSVGRSFGRLFGSFKFQDEIFLVSVGQLTPEMITADIYT